MASIRLSKSKIVLGLQCEKALYLMIHKPDLAGEVSDSQQRIFDQGTEVGIYAQSLFIGGTLIDAPYTNSQLALDQTQAAVKAGALHIYEATFQNEGVLVKIDILTRSGPKSSWEIVEVKSSTQVKDVHTQDAAIQMWVARNAGIKVKSASIMHINNKCVFPDLKNLFTRVDVTEESEALQPSIPKNVAAFQKLLLSKTPPKKDIGPHCNDPYECSFKEHCWSKKNIPEISTFDIPRLSEKAKWELYKKGTTALDSIDPSKFNPSQKRMVESTVSGKRFIDKVAIKREISNWEYPFAFLDFETIAYAIPRYPGLRPYQQLPFQFSCHLRERPKAQLKHCEYLHMDNSDPRKDVARALAETLPSSGSVIAYNASFERQVLNALADEFKKWQKPLRSIAERLVDPLPIFRAHVYDPKFFGSFSIKTVAPAIIGPAASYEGMMVGDGADAQGAFLELVHQETPRKRKSELTAGLLAYCRKDTMGMVELVDWLATK